MIKTLEYLKLEKEFHRKIELLTNYYKIIINDNGKKVVVCVERVKFSLKNSEIFKTKLNENTNNITVYLYDKLEDLWGGIYNIPLKEFEKSIDEIIKDNNCILYKLSKECELYNNSIKDDN